MSKPELSVTIKFRGVTVEGMTVEELRELRDLLDGIVGEKVRVVEREYVPVLPPQPIWTWRDPYLGPYWTTTISGTTLAISSTN